MSVHELGVRSEGLLVVDEAAQVIGATGDDLVHGLTQLRLLVHAELLVEAAQADHGVVVNHDERLNHGRSSRVDSRRSTNFPEMPRPQLKGRHHPTRRRLRGLEDTAKTRAPSTDAALSCYDAPACVLQAGRECE